MWSWLDSAGPFASGYGFALVLTSLLIAAPMLIYRGAVIAKTRTASLDIGGSGLALSGTAAATLGWVLTLAGFGSVILAATLLL